MLLKNYCRRRIRTHLIDFFKRIVCVCEVPFHAMHVHYVSCPQNRLLTFVFSFWFSVCLSVQPFRLIRSTINYICNRGWAFIVKPWKFKLFLCMSLLVQKSLADKAYHIFKAYIDQQRREQRKKNIFVSFVNDIARNKLIAFIYWISIFGKNAIERSVCRVFCISWTLPFDFECLLAAMLYMLLLFFFCENTKAAWTSYIWTQKR